MVNNYSTRACWIGASYARGAYTNCYKIQKERKNEKRDKKGTRIDHMTDRKRRQNLAK